jgi:hypothetical protein
MSFSPDNRLSRFVEDFFRLYGAEMDIGRDRMEVLVPEKLADSLGTPDHFQLQTGPNAQGDFAVGYGTLLLEKILGHVGGTVPVAECTLHFNYIKSQGFDRLIADSFTFAGASGTVENMASATTRYVICFCRYTAQSDEQKEGMISLCFNLETFAPTPGMEDALYLAEKRFVSGSRNTVLEKAEIDRLVRAVRKSAPATLAHEIEPFQASMNRRFKRDVENLNEYYAGLKREMEDSLKRPGLSDQLISERKEKIRLIPDEIEKKTDDLYKKYSIRTALALCGAVIVHTPVVKVRYKVSVGRKTTSLSLTYNPGLKTMDPVVCEGCGAGTFVAGFCDALHVLCMQCRSRCPKCKKTAG